MTICAETDGRSWQHCTRGMQGCICGTDDLHRAAMVLEVFNRWRREEKMPDGSDAPQPHPAAIGGAIETAIKALRALASPVVSDSEIRQIWESLGFRTKFANYMLEFAHALLARTAPGVAEGFVIVPKVPTQAMCQAGQWKAREWPKFPLRISPIYEAMIAAAPSADRGNE